MKKAIWMALMLASGSAMANDPWRKTHLSEWDNDVPGFVKGKFYVSGGLGIFNLSATLARTIKNSVAPKWTSVTVDAAPIWFAKAEYAIRRSHGLALTFAHGGFDINADLDSLTKYNVPVKGTLKYRTWSVLARYNLHFMPEKAFDMYLGISFGYRNNKFSVVDNDPDRDWWNFPIDLKFITRKIPNSISFPGLGGDFTLGMRYHIAPPIALYLELGIAKSVAQGGVVVRF